MENEIKVEVDFKKLQKVIKALLKDKKIKVGILSKSGGSQEISENIDLAGIGAVQEYGADIKITPKMAKFLGAKAKELGLPKSNKKGDGFLHIPARSFLYMPVVQHQAELRKKIKNLWGSDALEYIVEKGDLESLAIALGQATVNHIQDAFDSEGFGEWAKNSPFTIAQKGSASPLIDKGDLRRVIDYEIEDR